MTWPSRRSFLKGSAVVAGGALLDRPSLAAITASGVDASPLIATIDTSSVGDPISKYDYGMFIEHAGNLIYRGFWSELLDDRKFYFPISSVDPKPSADAAAAGGPRRSGPRKWRPVGPDEFVVMDTENPYVGEQSPRIKLDAATPHGIQQSGLGLRKGQVYTGRILLKATPGVVIKVSLIWGSGPADRQTTTISTAHSIYTKFPLKFTSTAETLEGRLEIVGTGTGAFHVGVLSLMPTDNVHGFRPDTTKLLRQLNSGMYRLPGGNFLSDHDWRDAVGDPDKRPPTWDFHWKAMQPNDIGIDEFVILCKLLDVDPYVTVNAGLGDDHSAAELVEYANGSIHTPQGALRAANGHPEPYHIKYWNVGNEPYGWWQIGHTALRFYVLKHNAFAKSMRKVDPSITVIASGAMPDEMTVTGNARLATGKVQAEYGTEGDWTGGLLANCWGNFDGLSEHWYAHAGKRFDPELNKDEPFKNGTTIQPTQYGFVPVTEPFLDSVRRGSNRVRLKAEAWEEYNKRFPAMKDKKIFLSLDEWAYGRADLRGALAYALVFHEMFRHTDYMKMSAFTFATACLEFNSIDATFSSNGKLFKMYRDHFGTLPVDVSGNSPQPAPKWPVGGDQPRINSGSPTYPLDLAAAFTADRKFLTVGVINPTDSIQPIELDIKDIKIGGKSKLWQLTGPSLDAADVLGQKPLVELAELQLPDASKTLSVTPISINIYEFPLL